MKPLSRHQESVPRDKSWWAIGPCQLSSKLCSSLPLQRMYGAFLTQVQPNHFPLLSALLMQLLQPVLSHWSELKTSSNHEEMDIPTSNCIRWETVYGAKVMWQSLVWPMEKYTPMEWDHWALCSQLGIGCLSKRSCYLVQQSPRLAEERTERKVMAGTELVLRRNLYEKCLRIPVDTQR